MVLRLPSDVKLSLSTLEGKEIKSQVIGNLNAGEQIVDLDVSGLATERYVYTIKVSNAGGTFKQSKLLIKN